MREIAARPTRVPVGRVSSGWSSQAIMFQPSDIAPSCTSSRYSKRRCRSPVMTLTCASLVGRDQLARRREHPGDADPGGHLVVAPHERTVGDHGAAQAVVAHEGADPKLADTP